MKNYMLASFAGAFLPGILGAISGICLLAICLIWVLDEAEKYFHRYDDFEEEDDLW